MNTDSKDIQYKPKFFADNDGKDYIIIRKEVIQKLFQTKFFKNFRKLCITFFKRWTKNTFS